MVEFEIRTNKSGTPFVKFGQCNPNALHAFKLAFPRRKYFAEKFCWSVEGTTADELRAWWSARVSVSRRDVHLDAKHEPGDVVVTAHGFAVVLSDSTSSRRSHHHKHVYVPQKYTYYVRPATAAESAAQPAPKSMKQLEAESKAADAVMEALATEVNIAAEAEGECLGECRPSGRPIVAINDSRILLESNGDVVSIHRTPIVYKGRRGWAPMDVHYCITGTAPRSSRGAPGMPRQSGRLLGWRCRTRGRTEGSRPWTPSFPSFPPLASPSTAPNGSGSWPARWVLTIRTVPAIMSIIAFYAGGFPANVRFPNGLAKLYRECCRPAQRRARPKRRP